MLLALLKVTESGRGGERPEAACARRAANGVAATFADAVDGITPSVAATSEEADDDSPALVAC